MDNKLRYVLTGKKPEQTHRHPHPLTGWKTSHPFWQATLDFMGLLPESDGFKYILLIGDQFSKWIEAVPMQTQEVKTVAKYFMECWVSRFCFSANFHTCKF